MKTPTFTDNVLVWRRAKKEAEKTQPMEVSYKEIQNKNRTKKTTMRISRNLQTAGNTMVMEMDKF